jgi:hypothetical protein
VRRRVHYNLKGCGYLLRRKRDLSFDEKDKLRRLP